MSAAGRKALPDEVKAVKGTIKKHRVNQDKPVAEPLVSLPSAPDWLNHYAQDEWYTVVTWLHGIGLLSTVDVSIIAAYCQNMGVYREAESKLRHDRVIVTDKGYEMPSPWVAIGNKALMQAMKIASEYGLTPSSRTRITVPKQKPKSRVQQLKDKRNGGV